LLIAPFLKEKGLCDLRSVAEASRLREQVENHRGACTQGALPLESRAGIFSLFRNSDWLAGTFRWSEDPSIAWLVPSTAEDPVC